MTQTVEEKVVPTLATDQITIIKADGKKEAFDPEKLRASLLRAGASPKSTDDVLSHIGSELYNDISTREIYQHAFAILKNLEQPVARRYSLRRAVMDLGPSGFPFEDFISEIFKAKGFNTLTRQTVLGGCVPHEIDLVAWNEKKLLMVEAKFHNELGTKSDLKVALYVKARFDDIRENVFNYGGIDRPLTEGWLITNTKFSSSAIHYGMCKDLVMVGWNYPGKGNLQDMIEEEGLHPITCLATLSEADKRILLTNGVILCSTVMKDPQVLQTYLGDKFKTEAIINEINAL